MTSSLINKDLSKLSCPASSDPCFYAHEIQQLKTEIDLLKQQVRIDALTGLYNFRFFSETLAVEMERVRRAHSSLALIILDIDHFKLFNDQWGHESGNKALVHIAKLMTLAVRKLDYACRFGGEEFVVILPNTDLQQAVHVAKRLCNMIAETPVNLSEVDLGEDGLSEVASGELNRNQNHLIKITASFGVDQYKANHSDTVTGFIERVDAWLYQAKRSGRNQVMHPALESAPQTTTVSLEERDALFGDYSVSDTTPHKK